MTSILVPQGPRIATYKGSGDVEFVVIRREDGRYVVCRYDYMTAESMASYKSRGQAENVAESYAIASRAISPRFKR